MSNGVGDTIDDNTNNKPTSKTTLQTTSNDTIDGNQNTNRTSNTAAQTTSNAISIPLPTQSAQQHNQIQYTHCDVQMHMPNTIARSQSAGPSNIAPNALNLPPFPWCAPPQNHHIHMKTNQMILTWSLALPVNSKEASVAFVARHQSKNMADIHAT
eukprot:985827_1